METDLILSMCVITFNKITTWLNLLQELRDKTNMHTLNGNLTKSPVS